MAIAALSLIAAGTSQHAAAADCAQRFHTSLTALATGEFQRLQSAIAEVTRPDASLPGTWMFFRRADRLKARLAARLEDGPLTRGDRACAETTIDRGGRIRCLKWVDKADAPARSAADLSGARDAPLAKGDLALLNTLWRIVRARGVLEEFDRNGRFYFLVGRSRDELGDYVRQPLRPGLCSGAPEVMGFYDNAFAPMRQRIEAFAKSAASAHRWISREQQRLDAEATKVAQGGTAAPNADDRPVAPASANAAPAAVADDILVALTRKHIAASLADRVAAAPSLVAKLALVEDAFSTPTADGEAGATTTTADSAGQSRIRIDVVPLLRAIEALAYADLALGRARRIDDGFKALMSGVTEAHRTVCTCEP